MNPKKNSDQSAREPIKTATQTFHPMALIRFTQILLVTFCLHLPALSKTIYVDQTNEETDADGSSWQTAFADIQPALDAAIPGDEIWVASGVYQPTRLAVADDPRSASFQLCGGVTMLGGFPPRGGDQSISARDLDLYPTILSGDLPAGDQPDGNAYHVVTATGLIATTTLKGFIIEDGRANSSNERTHETGGGITATDSLLDLINCRVIGNVGTFGGGIAANNSTINLINCLISGNAGLFAAGCYFTNNSVANIINCTITENATGYTGAGIYYENSTLHINNSILWSNYLIQSGKTIGDSNLAVSMYVPILPVDYATGSEKFTIKNSIIESSGGSENWLVYNGLDGGNNIDSNPHFISPAHPITVPNKGGNYKLLVTSPALNSGDGVARSSANPTESDIIGKPRFMGVIDLGAYEGAELYSFSKLYPELPPGVDSNGNGNSNYHDYVTGNDPRSDSYQTPNTPRMVGDNQIVFEYLAEHLADDVNIYFEKSTNLKDWTTMAEGADYTVISDLTIGTRQQKTIKVLHQKKSSSQHFYRYRSELTPIEQPADNSSTAKKAN